MTVRDALRAVVCAGALCALPAAVAAAGADGALIIRVRNHSHLSPVTLNRALDEVSRIFKRIGVLIRWIDGGEAQAASARLDVRVLDRELPELERRDRVILGAAPRTDDEAGRIAYVFYRPIEHLSDAHAVDVVLVLAHAIAHELGHLLLPSGHSTDGLMYGRWGRPQVRAATWGQLMFSKGEVALLRAAAAPEPVPILVRR